jgi:hypothetical protein
MRKYLIILRILIAIILLFQIGGCQDKSNIKNEIEITKNKIRAIDKAIYKLQRERARLLGVRAVGGGHLYGLAKTLVERDIDPVIYQLNSEREILIVRLESLMNKL